MKKILMCGIAMVSLIGMKAQNEAMVTQNLNNPLIINPAYAGSHEYTGFSLLHRNQWVNIEGAPNTSVLTVEGPTAGKKVGLGLVLAYDKIGITEQTDLYTSYAYHLKLNEASKLAFGLRVGISGYHSKLSGATIWDANDPVYQGGVQNSFVPKAGFGMYYYRERGFISMSIPSLFSYDQRTNASGENITSLNRHYYLATAYVLRISEDLQLKPFVQMRYHPAAPFQADASLNALVKDMVWIGAGYRSGDGFMGMLEYQVTNQLRIGYSYDMTTSVLSPYSAGTHEIMIGFDLRKDITKTKNPRFF